MALNPLNSSTLERLALKGLRWPLCFPLYCVNYHLI